MWKPILVGPLDVAKDTGKGIRVGLLNALQCSIELHTGLLGGLDDVCPVAAVGDDKRVVVGFDLLRQRIAKVFEGLGMLMVPAVADPLEEHHREDICLEVSGVHWPTKRVGSRPEC